MFCHTETRGVQTSPSTKHLHEGGNDVGIFKRFKISGLQSRHP